MPVFTFAQNYADCDSAFRVCNDTRLHFIGQAGEGAITKEVTEADCFRNSESYGNPEKNSVWMRFDIEEAGTMTFACE